MSPPFGGKSLTGSFLRDEMCQELHPKHWNSMDTQNDGFFLKVSCFKHGMISGYPFGSYMASVSSNQRTPCVDSAPVHTGSGISGIHVAVWMMGGPFALHYRELHHITLHKTQ